MNIDSRIAKSVRYLILLWAFPDHCGAPCLKFADRLAVIFFSDSLQRMIHEYYVLGRKHERKLRKKSMVKRYKSRIEESIPVEKREDMIDNGYLFSVETKKCDE